MLRHIHIAVLDTDVPVPTVYAARGLYSSQFRVLLQSAAARLNQSRHFDSLHAPQIKIHTSAYDVVGGSFPALGTLRKTAPCLEQKQHIADGGERHHDLDENDGENDGFRPIDAILITGSAASAYFQGEEYAWIARLQDFIRTVWKNYPHVKFFGSCFGHQIIAQALLVCGDDDSKKHDLDAPLVRVEACPMGFEIGIEPIALDTKFITETKLGAALFHKLREPKQSSADNDDKLRIQLIHGDRVVGYRCKPPAPVAAGISAANDDTTQSQPELLNALPKPWLNIGRTSLSPIQGLYYPNRVLTYQGHFEFDVFVNTETLIEFGRRASWDEQKVRYFLQKVQGQGGREDDSKLAAEIVVQFFVETDDDALDCDMIKPTGNKTDLSIWIEGIDQLPKVSSLLVNGLVTHPHLV